MDRRGFLLQSSLAWASFALPARLRAAPTDRPLQRIAFGSCNHAERDQSFWQYVLMDRPDLWIWLGDIVYADFASPKERRQSFQSLKENPYYAAFRGQSTVIGTWDDHDYGFNNADGDFAEKEASRDILLDFLDVPRTDPVWEREGIYQSYLFGPPGQQTQVILLDLRWGMVKYGLKQRLLDDAQWAWLENEIRGSSADLILIGSSLNVSSPITFAGGLEGWRRFPSEQQRLYALLDELPTPIVLLSGDRHFAEIYQIELPSGRLIYEVMSSGMTHAVGVKLPHPGRLVEMVGRKNYGLLEIDWKTSKPLVSMAIRSTEYAMLWQQVSIDFNR